ncbi:MAG TPA: DUF1570 domain-containing protein [Xanthomonadales bacterium]|nr:DUF1570 domain-containing protein [Xanthomonadales bacterium]
MRRILAVAAALALPSVALRAQMADSRDRVMLVDGKELRGRVMRFDADELVLRTGSVDRSIPRKQVRAFVSVASQHHELISKWNDTPVTDAAAMQALARELEQKGLPHEARLCLWYAALQRPDDAAIHKALGNREQNGRFLVQIDDRWVPFRDADALGVDFDDAWRLRSEHVAIRCAAGLRTALDTLMELEALYWTFQELFGRDLRLLEIVEPIEVRLYRTRQQMPNLSNTAGAYFAPDDPALYTCVENGRPYALMHEGTHALAHAFFVRAAKSRGELPGWLHEGWADYMDGRLQTRVPGKPARLERSMQAGLAATLADAQKRGDLYGVHRLLNFKPSDFGASSRQDTKYAQSWALFRWLFENADPALHAQFVQYLREATTGQGQASTFRRIFGKQEKELETAPWRP